jgi:hypothetical protein
MDTDDEDNDEEDDESDEGEELPELDEEGPNIEFYNDDELGNNFIFIGEEFDKENFVC